MNNKLKHGMYQLPAGSFELIFEQSYSKINERCVYVFQREKEIKIGEVIRKRMSEQIRIDEGFYLYIKKKGFGWSGYFLKDRDKDVTIRDRATVQHWGAIPPPPPPLRF